MKAVNKIRDVLGDEWLPLIYQTKIRSQRTRSYSLEIPAKHNGAIIQHTLLGVELKVGNRRFACPDLSTARYLQVFAWVGCGNFAIPYDISKTSSHADELESAWHKTILLVDEESNGKTASVRGRLRSAVIKTIRSELDEIGAGKAMPEFKKSTKQQKYSS